MKNSSKISLTFVVLSATLLGCPSDPATPASSSSGGSNSSGGGGSSSGGGGGKAFACKGKGAAGVEASPFTMESLNGAGKVAVTPGKVTLVDFWATWCGPCEKSFPKYQDLYVKYKSSGLEIAAVSVDDDSKEIAAFVKKTSVKFPVGWSAESKKIADCYTVPNMPSAFIVDKKGVIRFVHNGYKGDEEAKKIEEEIKGLL
jgi:cytochrome c biogenesis protein CcmG, thiol:disulfide interchange protein DsbE